MTCALALAASPALADAMDDARAIVERHAGEKTTWDGPTTGPAAAADKTIVVLSGDMKNGGILGATNGVVEAAEAIGWEVRVIAGAGSVRGRTAAFGQALALQPDGIVINGFDAAEQAVAMREAQAADIPLVSWHASPEIGPDPEAGIFANVTTDPRAAIASAMKPLAHPRSSTSLPCQSMCRSNHRSRPGTRFFSGRTHRT